MRKSWEIFDGVSLGTPYVEAFRSYGKPSDEGPGQVAGHCAGYRPDDDDHISVLPANRPHVLANDEHSPEFSCFGRPIQGFRPDGEF
jgi:hypothetical protein